MLQQTNLINWEIIHYPQPQPIYCKLRGGGLYGKFFTAFLDTAGGFINKFNPMFYLCRTIMIKQNLKPPVQHVKSDQVRVENWPSYTNSGKSCNKI